MLLCLLCGCTGEEKSPSPEPEEIEAASNVPDPVPAAAPEEVPEPVPEPDPRQETVDDLLSRMSLEEKVGQMFFVRCPELNALEKIGQYRLGGYLLVPRDLQDAGGGGRAARGLCVSVSGV